jgi:hypothetical protein
MPLVLVTDRLCLCLSLFSTTTTSGHLNLIELSTGTAKSKFKAHGGIVNGNETSGIVRDVVSFGESELPDTWRVISVGYDGRIQISR